MPEIKEKKKELIKQYQRHKSDTGSPEIVIAILTEKINTLTNHLVSNPKDYQSQKGLLTMVSDRKSQLSYLKNKDKEAFRRIVEHLEIRS